jgi:hypothetical protein
MPEPIDRQQFAPQVRAMQIIVSVLAMAVAVYAVVVIVLDSGDPPEEPIQSLVGVVVGFAVLVMGTVVPRRMGGQSVGIAGVGEYQRRLIVRCAMFEAGAFVNLTAYMLEGQVYSLVIALVLWLAILMQFPTVGRVTEWLERHERTARDEAFEN